MAVIFFPSWARRCIFFESAFVISKRFPFVKSPDRIAQIRSLGLCGQVELFHVDLATLKPESWRHPEQLRRPLRPALELSRDLDDVRAAREAPPERPLVQREDLAFASRQDDLADPLQLGEREPLGHQVQWKSVFSDPLAQRGASGPQLLRVVEGQIATLGVGVGPAHHIDLTFDYRLHLVARQQRVVQHAERPVTRVAVGAGKGAYLLQVRHFDADLVAQRAPRRHFQVVIDLGFQHRSRQRPLAGGRIFRPLHQQHLQAAIADAEERNVGRHKGMERLDHEVSD